MKQALKSFSFYGLGIFVLVSFLFTFGFSSGTMLQPLLSVTLNLSETEIGTLFFLSSFCSGLVRVPAGIFSDRFGRRLSIIIAGVSLCVSGTLYIFSTNFLQLLVPFIFWGVAIGFYWTSHSPMIADLTQESTRIAAFSRIAIINLIANIISPLITGFLADEIGVVFTFLVPASSFLAMSVISLRIPKAVEKTKRPTVKTDLKSIFTGTVGNIVLTFALLNVVHGFFWGMWQPSLPIIFKNLFNLSYSEIGLLNTISMLSQAFGLTLCGRIVAKLNSKVVMAISTACSTVVILGYIFTNSVTWLFPLSIFSGFFVSLGFFSAISDSLFMNKLSGSIRGISQGITGSLWRFGMATGGFAMGNIWKNYGIITIPYVGSALLVIEVIVILTRIPKE